MSKVIIFRNFLSYDECNELNNIARNGVDEGWINVGYSYPKKHLYDYSDSGLDSNYTLRFTSRMHMTPRNKEYPLFVINIRDKIIKTMKLQDFPQIENHGNSSVVVSYTFKNGFVYEHKDPRPSLPNSHLGTYRMNVMTQKNEDGGKLYVDGECIDINVGDLHCYFVSENYHYVSHCKGDTPRIMWMFGKAVPLNHDFSL